ncbi:hypothetical protein QTP70_030179 [Hemibagrus guttatus]|uniref:Tetraspanin n=1 Tax=Hemibagrus guttatus TaxID=175788 RepID=A0AAE0Q8D4_9TELE|nr:hypothetical protein QTP70_030179 [Hemibagrus guttatus]KAK3541235.1 hypothetical protein QTP86_016919 [Hemibagrus guttatus]
MAGGCILALMVIVVILNIFAAATGLALMALAIWVVVDPYKMYPICAASGKTDIFAAAWIAIFTGFAYFCIAIFGIFAALKRKRSLMLTYLILMFIIYIFECASCITAVTNRDYLLGNSNQVKYQMLKYYTDTSSQGKDITSTWNKVMADAQCCGTDSPLDWVEYNSTFMQTSGGKNLWPINCCLSNVGTGVSDPNGCKLGLSTAMFNKGCFSYIESTLNRYTWAICWYGFSVQMFMFFVLLIGIVYVILLD